MDDSGGIPPPVNRLQDSSLRLKWRLFRIFETFLVFLLLSTDANIIKNHNYTIVIEHIKYH